MLSLVCFPLPHELYNQMTDLYEISYDCYVTTGHYICKYYTINNVNIPSVRICDVEGTVRLFNAGL
jgi:hypothetical protein